MRFGFAVHGVAGKVPGGLLTLDEVPRANYRGWAVAAVLLLYPRALLFKATLYLTWLYCFLSVSFPRLPRCCTIPLSSTPCPPLGAAAALGFAPHGLGPGGGCHRCLVPLPRSGFPGPCSRLRFPSPPAGALG